LALWHKPGQKTEAAKGRATLEPNSNRYFWRPCGLQSCWTVSLDSGTQTLTVLLTIYFVRSIPYYAAW